MVMGAVENKQDKHFKNTILLPQCVIVCFCTFSSIYNFRIVMPLINSTTQSLSLVYMFRYCTCKVCRVCACLIGMPFYQLCTKLHKEKTWYPTTVWFPPQEAIKTSAIVTCIRSAVLRTFCSCKQQMKLKCRGEKKNPVNHYMTAVTLQILGGIFPPIL